MGWGVVGIQRKANRVHSCPRSLSLNVTRVPWREQKADCRSEGVARGGVAWPTRMPVSRRARFAPPRRTNREARHGQDAETGGDEVGIVQSAEGLQVEPAPDGSMLKDIALTLWTPNYDHVFQLELERNRAALVSRGGTLGGFGLTVYAKRLTGHHREVWERRQLVRERDQLAIALHADNMRHWSPSLVARSVSYFTLTTSWMHHVESGQRRLASRPTTLKVLRWMRDRAQSLVTCMSSLRTRWLL
jgi:hypothetical protein